MDRDHSNLLKNWAFLQVAPDEFWVWQGPWAESAKPPLSQPALWLSDFFLKNRLPWRSHASQVPPRRMNRLELIQSLGGVQGKGVESLPLHWEAARSDFFEAHFESLQDWIRDGVLKKGVPVASKRAFFREDARADESLREAWIYRVLSQLGSIPPHLFLYGYCSEGQGFIGATPEVLFELTPERQLKTMALAGTQRISEKSEDFGRNPKDQNEHFAVVDDIVQRLTRLALPGTLTQGQMEVRRFGILEHLHTPIEAKIGADIGFEQLLLLLHPTAALGVHPRVKTGHRWLDKMDAFDRRESFGAPFGVQFPDGSAFAVVAIRQIQFDARGLKIWAGAGVVEESQLEKEWAEIELKMESICRTFGLPLGESSP